MSSTQSSIAIYGTAPVSLANLDWFEFDAGGQRYAIFASDISRGRGAQIEVNEQFIQVAAIHPIDASSEEGDAIKQPTRIRQVMTQAMQEELPLTELLVLISSRDAA